MDLVGAGQIVTTALVVAGAIALVWSALVDRRRRDVAETYKELYAASSAKVEHLEHELAELRARVAVLEGDLIRKVAEGVALTVADLLERHHGSK
jgi:hypothetical protein